MQTVVMPQLGESIVEGTIVRFLVKPGTTVKRGEILAEVETDKATSEIPAPKDGVVGEILVDEGATVEVGAPLLRLDGEAEPGPPAGTERLPPQRLAPQPSAPPRTSPSVRRLAREKNVDLDEVQGSGPRGRVTRSDVMERLETPSAVPSAPPPLATPEATPFPTTLPQQADPGYVPPAYRPPVYRPAEVDEVVPFSRRRRLIAEHMLYSQQTAAHVFAVAEIDMGRVQRRKEEDQARASAAGVRLTFLPYVVEAVAQALAEYPTLNATVVQDALVKRRDKNIGVAVDTAEGLVVPVIHRADELGVLGLARKIQELADRALEGKLSPEDVSGGSFTISNPGKRGNLYGASIIRQPEVAILRMGAAVKRPVVREVSGEDVIVVRPMMHAALSYDHRVIDGRVANDFLYRLTELLQSA